MTEKVNELQTRIRAAEQQAGDAKKLALINEQRANEPEAKLAEANTALATLKQQLPNNLQGASPDEEASKSLPGLPQETSLQIEICVSVRPGTS